MIPMRPPTDARPSLSELPLDDFMRTTKELDADDQNAVELVCDHCGRTFTTPWTHRNVARYCSQACINAERTWREGNQPVIGIHRGHISISRKETAGI